MLFFILIAMLLCHCLYDFHLQGILASMKQKEWWTSQEQYKPKYRNDYKMALIIHAFEWSCFILLPMFLYFLYVGETGTLAIIAFVLLLLINLIIHAFIDHLKANKGRISLVQDQVAHMFQVFISFALLSLILM